MSIADNYNLNINFMFQRSFYCLALILLLNIFSGASAKNIFQATSDFFRPESEDSSFSQVSNDPVNEIERKKVFNKYITEFCGEEGRAFFRIQKGISVDCLTNQNLWKFAYAEDWKDAMIEAMRYRIYDVYVGDDIYAPKPGVVLIHRNHNDYKYRVKLQEIISHYELPIDIRVMEDYHHTGIDSTDESSLKDSQIYRDFESLSNKLY